MTQSILITLLTAFVGALIAAGLSYLVRKTLDEKALVRTEKRLAYVQFVHLSDMIALQIAIKSYFQITVPASMISALPRGDDFNLSHVLFKMATNYIQKIDVKEKLKDLPVGGAFSLVVEQQIESLQQLQLSPEQLSKLPERAVKEYQQFSKSLSEIKTFLTFVTRVFENDSKFLNNLEWFTAEFLSNQWQVIERFIDRSRKARSILGALAGVSQEASAALLKEQLEIANKQIIDTMKHKTSLAAAAREALIN